MKEIVLLDLDDTILDFRQGERRAIAQTLTQFGLGPEPEVLERYHHINRAHWERLERGEITREEVLTGRFRTLFQELGKSVDPVACARTYEKNLSNQHDFLPGALEALESLRGSFRLFLASNGTASVQHRRLTDANLYRFFEGVFISQEIGFNKPSIEYFSGCFAKIPNFSREKAVMVGDSLTSDILGGKNAGISTVWVNPQGKPWEKIQPDYEIAGLPELEALLRRL